MLIITSIIIKLIKIKIITILIITVVVVIVVVVVVRRRRKTLIIIIILCIFQLNLIKLNNILKIQKKQTFNLK